MSPVELLRHFFENDEILRPMATQAGFANLLNRSEVLIRTVEKGRLKVSGKLAKRISIMTGVPEDWLQGTVEETDKIPSRDGGDLTAEKLKNTIIGQSLMPRFDSSENSPAVNSILNRTMIDHVMSIIREEVIAYSANPNPNQRDPTAELLEWMAKRIATRGNSHFE